MTANLHYGTCAIYIINHIFLDLNFDDRSLHTLKNFLMVTFDPISFSLTSSCCNLLHSDSALVTLSTQRGRKWMGRVRRRHHKAGWNGRAGIPRDATWRWPRISPWREAVLQLMTEHLAALLTKKSWDRSGNICFSWAPANHQAISTHEVSTFLALGNKLVMGNERQKGTDHGL